MIQNPPRVLNPQKSRRIIYNAQAHKRNSKLEQQIVYKPPDPRGIPRSFHTKRKEEAKIKVKTPKSRNDLKPHFDTTKKKPRASRASSHQT